jgi:hypothetical protein
MTPREVLRDMPKAIAGIGVFALVALVSLIDLFRMR